MELPSSSGREKSCFLKWDDYHANMTKGLTQLLNDKDFSMTDVTLACEGQFIRAHKIVLAVCSPFFMEYFKTYSMDKPGGLIVLANVKFDDLKSIVDFIYHGQLDVTRPNLNLDSLLRTAKDLKIEGLLNALETGSDKSSLNSTSEQALQSSNQCMLSTEVEEQEAIPRLPVSGSSKSSEDFESPLKKRFKADSPRQDHRGISIIQTKVSTSSASLSGSSDPLIIPENGDGVQTVKFSPVCNYDATEPEAYLNEDEEMMNLNELKLKALSVHTFSDDDDSLESRDGCNVSGAKNIAYEWGEIFCDFDSSGPGSSSSASLQSDHHPQSGSIPKPANKQSDNESSSSELPVISQMTDALQISGCKKCGGMLCSDDDLLHVCINFPVTGKAEPAVMCTHCGKMLKNKNSLKVHKSNYHRQINPSKVVQVMDASPSVSSSVRTRRQRQLSAAGSLEPIEVPVGQ